jgi:hypothetical protein
MHPVTLTQLVAIRWWRRRRLRLPATRIARVESYRQLARPADRPMLPHV